MNTRAGTKRKTGTPQTLSQPPLTKYYKTVSKGCATEMDDSKNKSPLKIIARKSKPGEELPNPNNNPNDINLNESASDYKCVDTKEVVNRSPSDIPESEETEGDIESKSAEEVSDTENQEDLESKKQSSYSAHNISECSSDTESYGSMGCVSSHDEFEWQDRPRLTNVSRWSQQDTDNYRRGYPNKTDNKELRANLDFYQNKIKSEPDGNFIDEIHKTWYGDYELLERHHGYIQWLFPLQESGMNYSAQELQPHEIEELKKDSAVLARFRKSYELMLDFYGIQLENEETGFVSRADHWQPRFRHLNNSFHNYLRITRILKCLGELKHEHYKEPLIKFFINECFVTKKLPSIKTSLVDYWIHTLKDDVKRHELAKWVNDIDKPRYR